MCVRQGGHSPVKISGLACGMFSARRNCSTCGYRCPPGEVEEMWAGGECRRWTLKRLSGWGGRRIHSTPGRKGGDLP